MFRSLLISFAAGLVSSMPYCKTCDAPGPTFTAFAVNLRHPGNYPAIRSVDFKNLALAELNIAGKRIGNIPLRDGRYEGNGPYRQFEEHLESVHYLTASSNAEFALALYSWIGVGVSSSRGSEAFLFALRGGRLKCREVIRWDTHFDAEGPTHSFDSRANSNCPCATEHRVSDCIERGALLDPCTQLSIGRQSSTAKCASSTRRQGHCPGENRRERRSYGSSLLKIVTWM